MLLNEDRLRDLYAAGEITLDEFNTSLDRILKRETTERRPAASRASAPMTTEEREAWAARIAAAPGPRQRRLTHCPDCRTDLRQVHEHGVETAWCRNCQAYVGVDPRNVDEQEPTGGGGGFVGGVTFPLDPGLFG